MSGFWLLGGMAIGLILGGIIGVIVGVCIVLDEDNEKEKAPKKT